MTHQQPSQTSGNVARMLWDTATRRPAWPAVVERSRSATYADLRDRAAAFGQAVVDAGAVPGDRVVVLLDRGIDAVAAYFGVLAAGAVAVVLNPLLRPRQVEYALEHSGARVFLTARSLRARVHRDVQTAATTIDAEDVPWTGALEPVRRVPADAAQITYTSGSTGMPKGVVGTHGNVWSVIDTVVSYLGLDENDRLAGLLPISGVYGANQMLCAVFTGATLVVPMSPIMNQIAAELREADVTVLAAVPPLWMQLLQAPGFVAEPIPSLRILQNAGGHLAPAAARQLRDVQPQAGLFLQYGMTEVFRSTYLPPDEIDEHPGSMGRPMAGAEILVVADDGSVCGPDVVGELVHSGPTVAAGYWNDPERTAEVFRAHPLDPGRRAVFSGDMVRRDADGYLYFVGRRDRMIKTLGYRVGPDEVLDVLYASGEITEGIVSAEVDSERGQRIVAYVVLRSGGSLKQLRAYCRAELPRYMQPTDIAAVSELPRLPNGKHDLIALRAQVAGNAPA